MKRALVVCLGNICRSPLGEGLLRHHAAVQGLRLQVASAGTSGLHAGEGPDRRSVEVARRHRIDISGQQAPHLSLKDLERYDVVLAMDAANQRDIEALAKRVRERGGNPALVVAFDAAGDVPDPYYGGAEGFEQVFGQIDAAAASWVQRWKSETP